MRRGVFIAMLAAGVLDGGGGFARCLGGEPPRAGVRALATRGAQLPQRVAVVPTESANGATPPRRFPLVAEGFCVVALRDRQQWREGDGRHPAIFDGHEYLFENVRSMSVFAAAPESYAPMLGGDCPVAYADTGVRTPGKIEFGAIHRRKIVFCASAEALAEFRADPDRYADVDLALGGKCPVARVDEGRTVRGLPGTSTTYRGLRYWFAHDLARRVFLDNPERYRVKDGLPEPTASSPGAGAIPGDHSSGDGASHAADSPPAPALDGYCPVSLATRGLWVRGQSKYRVELGGAIFYLAGSHERDLLLAEPEKYLPAFGGDCVVSYVDHGERIPGSVYHAASSGGRLYLFAGPKELAKFVASRETYTSVRR